MKFSGNSMDSKLIAVNSTHHTALRSRCVSTRRNRLLDGSSSKHLHSLLTSFINLKINNLGAI